MLCEEEDSLHGSYPTSTSTEITGSRSNDSRDLEGTQKHQNAPVSTQTGEFPRQVQNSSPASPSLDLQGEALELLHLAALRKSIDGERATTFVRSVLGESDVGRYALQVLEGGPHAARALVELAAIVSRRRSEQGSGSSEGGAG